MTVLKEGTEYIAYLPEMDLLHTIGYNMIDGAYKVVGEYGKGLVFNGTTVGNKPLKTGPNIVLIGEL